MRLPIKVDKAGLKLTDENGHVLADFGMLTNEEQDQIVRAVNSHEALLGYLRQIADLANENTHSVQDGYALINEWSTKAIAQAEKGA
jgi:hypothetical protein